MLPAGALLWQWEADADFDEAAGEEWRILLPAKWKKQTIYGWRFDPRELRAEEPPVRPARPANERRGAMECED